MVRTASSEKAKKAATAAKAAKPSKPATPATRRVMTQQKVLNILSFTVPNDKKFRELREKLTKDVKNFYQSKALPTNMDDAAKMCVAVCQGSFDAWRDNADYQRKIKNFYNMIQSSICLTFMLP
jgi:hypothetical protein